MITESTFRNLALSFPGTVELPHFQKTSFRVNKKIFSTLDQKTQLVNCKLTIFDQEVFCSAEPHSVFPVANKWGQQGWTSIRLQVVSEALLCQIIEAAINTVLKNGN
jgi:hypothetical protein